MAHPDWSTLSNFIDALRDAEKYLDFEEGEERFYRGNRDSSWSLLPTLMREYDASDLDEAESDLFWEFRARAKELHQLNLSSWDMLFFMRHHGVPTRLLDWTETLGVALYFALEGHIKGERIDSEPCIWLLNPYRLNGEDGDKEDLWEPKLLGYDADEDSYYDYDELLLERRRWWWREPLAIYPQQRPSRMGAQRGWFTIHGSSTAALEKQCPRDVIRVGIPEKAIPTIVELLSITGIDPYSIYADLDGLADSLKLKNRAGRPVPTLPRSPARTRPIAPKKRKRR